MHWKFKTSDENWMCVSRFPQIYISNSITLRATVIYDLYCYAPLFNIICY